MRDESSSMAKKRPAPETRRKSADGIGANVWTSHLLRLDSVEADVLRTLDATTLNVAAVAAKYGVNAASLGHWVAERRGPRHLKQRMGAILKARHKARREAEDTAAPDPSEACMQPLDIDAEVRRLRRAERTWSYVVHALRIDLHQIAAARAAYFDEGMRMQQRARA